jgi:hypothetical protein
MEQGADRTVSRRGVLRYSGGLVIGAMTAVAMARASWAAPATIRTVYSLDPTSCVAGEDGKPDCGACNACHGHALKVFSSQQLANTTRAHRFCNCAVRAKDVSNSDFVGFFGPPGGPLHRDQFDPRRDKPFNSVGKT